MSARPHVLTVDNPYTGGVAVEVPYVGPQEGIAAVQRAKKVQRAWAEVPVRERVALIGRFCEVALAMKEETAREISAQMGKPVKQAHGEVETMVKRAQHMASIAEEALADVPVPGAENFDRRIVREPVGVVLTISPWNYPLLTTVNSVVPAVLAGNAVIIKPSGRTPTTGMQFAKAFEKAGAPKDLVQSLLVNHEDTKAVIARPEIGYVAFTGSVRGGHEIYAEVAKRFINCGLELGGKDPAYVAPDADFDHAVENLVDGAFYNAGQSCCGIERIYVHESLYKKFVDAYVALVKQYKLGDPMDEATTMGPMAQANTPAFLKEQIDEAKAKGGKLLCGGAPIQVNGKGRFFDPAVVVDATHAMGLMMEESFGPVIGITAVKSDEEAVEKMNDSPYGLTCAIWTADAKRAERIARQLETGTVFMNRCDYLDPALPWTGVKDTGKGVSLSKFGFHDLTRLKGLHFRLKTR